MKETLKNIVAWIVFMALVTIATLISKNAHAQIATQADIGVDYTLPTKNTDGTPIPATGPNSLAKARFYLSTAPIPNDVSALTPALEAPPGTTATVPFSAAIGDTLHLRITVCNVAGVCSDPTNEVTGIIVGAKPGSAVINTLTIRIR